MDVDDFAARLIRIRAEQLMGRYGFTESDRYDIEQELTLDLIRRLPSFDPTLGTRDGFIACRIDLKVANIVQAQRRIKRHGRGRRLSLDAPLPGPDGSDTEPLGALIPARDEDIDLAIDVRHVVAGMPPHLRTVCNLLLKKKVTQIAEELGVSRRTVHRWIGEVRAIFEEAGLDGYF